MNNTTIHTHHKPQNPIHTRRVYAAVGGTAEDVLIRYLSSRNA
jgi:hypothetical protein